ncbi:MAG TPA: sigma-70 family RNA polymerase sigma factor [Ignavibacteria bacterium]|nr:sigma-70 family RNA polymerase sigma factor [Ignavibacteria bacterium]
MVSDSNEFFEYLKPVYSDCIRFCKYLTKDLNKFNYEDIFQQSMLVACEKFYSLNDKSKFKSWIFTIILRESKNYYRKNFWKKFISIEEITDSLNLEYTQDSIEDIDKKTLLMSALKKLSKKEKESILLFELGGFSIEEIKDIQNEKSISSVKSRLSRSRKKLKIFINKNKPDFNINNRETLENETIKILQRTNG